MPTEREILLARLQNSPGRLSRLVEPQPIEILKRAGPDGSWGAIEILAHLRDWDEVTYERIERILNEDTPALETYDCDLWAIERDYHAQNPSEVLASFRELRARLVSQLSGLPEAAWERTANHPMRGRITLEELVRQLDAHDQEHFHTLKDVLL